MYVTSAKPRDWQGPHTGPELEDEEGVAQVQNLKVGWATVPRQDLQGGEAIVQVHSLKVGQTIVRVQSPKGRHSTDVGTLQAGDEVAQGQSIKTKRLHKLGAVREESRGGWGRCTGAQSEGDAFHRYRAFKGALYKRRAWRQEAQSWGGLCSAVEPEENIAHARSLKWRQLLQTRGWKSSTPIPTLHQRKRRWESSVVQVSAQPRSWRQPVFMGEDPTLRAVMRR